MDKDEVIFSHRVTSQDHFNKSPEWRQLPWPVDEVMNWVLPTANNERITDNQPPSESRCHLLSNSPWEEQRRDKDHESSHLCINEDPYLISATLNANWLAWTFETPLKIFFHDQVSPKSSSEQACWGEREGKNGYKMKRSVTGKGIQKKWEKRFREEQERESCNRRISLRVFSL